VKGGYFDSYLNLFNGRDIISEAGEDKDCGMDPYLVVHDKSEFVDMQTLKLQETPDMVPTGELPRHLLLSVDRYGSLFITPNSKIN
jgi:DNA replication licensing factor MCM5